MAQTEASSKTPDTLRLVLGDQLNQQHSWFAQTDDTVVYLLAELPQETTYVKHHVQKLCAFFAAMAEFAAAMEKKGHRVLHLTLDATADCKDLLSLLKKQCKKYRVSHFQYQRPDEHRLLEQLRSLKLGKDVEISEVDSEHFLLPWDKIEEIFPRGKHVRMENFYRRMRKDKDVLMAAGKPEGGEWNFDKKNRQPLKTDDLEQIPEPLCFENDVSDIIERLDRHDVESIGRPSRALIWPVSRRQALRLLRNFCDHCLPNFGRFQDAMTDQVESRWSLYHSRLSFALNSKMLSPTEVIERAVSAYRDSNDIDIAQIEGFVRQILGWREYVRGVYWANMPDYARRNHYRAQSQLPEFYWTGETRMRCVSEAIGQSLDYSYAHHIQRLMITGNFALLTGIKPDAVDAWYLGIYVDAIEWAEMPNTRGMALFADGGIVGTKPYAAGGNYINKMSDYCKSCHYRVREKTGDRACPFNSLYWRFMNKHREELSSNQRLGMLFGSWDRQSDEQKSAVLNHADGLMKKLDSL